MAQVLPLKYEHTDQITVIARSQSGSIIATGGKDGAVLIRNGKDLSLKLRIQVGYLPIEAISVNAKHPIVAIFQTDNIDAYLIRVINYNKGEELYSLRLSQKPLFIAFSESGNYLIYSNPQQNGLTIIDSLSGNKKNWLTSIDTIVPTCLMSPDDLQLVTYSSAGAIRFYDIKRGTLRKEISAMSNLENPTFVQNGTILLGNTRDKLVAIQTSSGKAFNEVRAKGIIRIVPDNTPGNIAIYTTEDGFAFLQRWNYTTRSVLENIDLNQDFTLVSSLLYHNNIIICGTTSGNLFGYNQQNKKFQISNLELSRFTGIACDDTSLILTDNDSVLRIPLNDVSKLKNISSVTHGQLKMTRPFKGSYQIVKASNDGEIPSYLFYKNQGSDGDIYLYEPSSYNQTNNFTKIFTTQSPIIKLKQIDNGYLALTKSGKSFILNKQFKTTFNYESFGTRDVTLINQQKLIAGRAKDSLFKSTMVQLNAYTGETLPLKTDDLITFDLNYNKELLCLYTIGIENRNGQTRTVLKAYRGNNFTNAITLLSVPGEDHKATLLYDPFSTKIYTTLGSSGIRVIQWGGFTTNQKAGHIPDTIQVNRNFLFSLNQDGSVSCWNKKNGKEYFTLYQFKNGSWTLLDKEQTLPNNPLWNEYKAF